MDVSKLKGAIKCEGMSQSDVADKIGCSLSRFNAKLNERDGAEFGLRELRALKGLLKLSDKDAANIFFDGV